MSNKDYLTLFVFCKSYSMPLIRLRDSWSMSSFSWGILVGLLISSVTTVSNCCSLCRSGSTSIAGGVPRSWELGSANGCVGLVDSNRFTGCCTVNIFPDHRKNKYIYANILNKKWNARLATWGIQCVSGLLGATLVIKSSVATKKSEPCKIPYTRSCLHTMHNLQFGQNNTYLSNSMQQLQFFQKCFLAKQDYREVKSHLSSPENKTRRQSKS